MGEPLKVGGKCKRYNKIDTAEDKENFDKKMEEAGLGSQHKNGLSSERGRSTYIYRDDGKRIEVRKDGKLLVPEEAGAVGKMSLSVYDHLEQSGRLERV